MTKFKKDLNSSTFMYQGRSLNASNRPTDQKKKNVTLKSLNIGDKKLAGVATKGMFIIVIRICSDALIQWFFEKL